MAKKKKSQNTNQPKTAQKISKYTCPFCHKPGTAKITLKKSDDKKSMEGQCICSNCDAKHRVPQIRLIDTEKNVYARWEQYARMLKTSPIRCCDELTILFIEKQGPGTIGRVECQKCMMNGETPRIFNLGEGESEQHFRDRIQRKLNGLETTKVVQKKQNKRSKKQEESESHEYYEDDEINDVHESVGEDVNKSTTEEEPFFQKPVYDEDDDI